MLLYTVQGSTYLGPSNKTLVEVKSLKDLSHITPSTLNARSYELLTALLKGKLKLLTDPDKEFRFRSNQSGENHPTLFYSDLWDIDLMKGNNKRLNHIRRWENCLHQGVLMFALYFCELWLAYIYLEKTERPRPGLTTNSFFQLAFCKKHIKLSVKANLLPFIIFFSHVPLSNWVDQEPLMDFMSWHAANQGPPTLALLLEHQR